MWNDYEETKWWEWLLIIIIIIFFYLIWILGNIAMLVCGSLGIVGILDINLGGSIAMVVLGSIFGAWPIFKAIF